MNRKHTKISGSQGCFLAVLLSLAGTALPQQSYAISLTQYFEGGIVVRDLSLEGDIGPLREDIDMAVLDHEYLAEQNTFGLTAIGGAFIDGSFLPYDAYTPGQELNLSFAYVDPATGATITGPRVTGVIYEAQLNPANPGNWFVIGDSADSSDNFAITWQGLGIEPMIEAIPYFRGNQIVISGVDGDNDAVGLDTALHARVLNVPDAGQTSVLLGVCMAGLAGLRRWSKAGNVK